MKTTMKLFAALTIMLGISVTCLGQQTETNNISANATVFGSAAVGTVRNLEFGNLTLTGGTKTISVAGVATGNTSIPSTVNQGTFSITKPYNAGTIDLALSYPSTLTGSISGILPIAYVATFNNLIATGAGGTAFTMGATSGSAQVGVNNLDPTLYVHVGGTVTPGGSTVAGIYTGTITLSATFN